MKLGKLNELLENIDLAGLIIYGALEDGTTEDVENPAFDTKIFLCKAEGIRQ